MFYFLHTLENNHITKGLLNIDRKRNIENVSFRLDERNESLHLKDFYRIHVNYAIRKRKDDGRL